MPSYSEHLRSNPPLNTVLRRFAQLLEPKSDQELEQMAGQAQQLTRQFFGRTIRMFAPLYLSNECVNICRYCGFSRDNPIFRTTLSVEQVAAETLHLAEQGFRNLLLVAGEHPKFVSGNYLVECVQKTLEIMPGISLEVGPMETEEYRPIVQAGAEGLVVYQETYHREAYAELHVAGPKKDFDWRLDCPERAYAAGFRRLGIGALFGLAPWKEEAMALARHTDYLLRTCWKSFLTISLPRLRPAAGGFHPKYPFADREFVQTLLALRLCFPQIGLVLSTREPAGLRDRLIPLGITLMSAGSHTEPGGYTGVGREKLHRTEKGKFVALIDEESSAATATEQFAISDDRTASAMAARIRDLGYEPVWKDWEDCLSTSF